MCTSFIIKTAYTRCVQPRFADRAHTAVQTLLHDRQVHQAGQNENVSVPAVQDMAHQLIRGFLAVFRNHIQVRGPELTVDQNNGAVRPVDFLIHGSVIRCGSHHQRIDLVLQQLFDGFHLLHGTVVVCRDKQTVTHFVQLPVHDIKNLIIVFDLHIRDDVADYSARSAFQTRSQCVGAVGQRFDRGLDSLTSRLFDKLRIVQCAGYGRGADIRQPGDISDRCLLLHKCLRFLNM